MPSPAGKGDREAVDEENDLLPPSGREGDHEVVEGARGYESNDLPFMRCLPLFSLVEAKVSSLLCAFSFRHPCGAGRWGEATAPCSHPGGSLSDSRRRAEQCHLSQMAAHLPYRNLKISAYPNQKHSFHFAFRRNIIPQVYHLPTAANFTRRRRISLFNRRGRLNPMPPSGREGDREAGEGARGYESNDLPFMRCLPLFSSVGTKMSSLLCAFSFSRVATAPSRREPFR